MILRQNMEIDKIGIIFGLLIFYGISDFAVGEDLQYSTGMVAGVPKHQEATVFLKEYDREALEMCNRIANTKWRYEINATDYNKRRMREQKSLAAKFQCISWRCAKSINIETINDLYLKRQYEKILQVGHCGLGDTKFLELQHVLILMEDNYNNAKICRLPFNNSRQLVGSSSLSAGDSNNYNRGKSNYCDRKIDQIMLIMQNSQSEPELRYTWTSWRDIVGPPIRNTFMRYLDLTAQSAKTQGFHDAGDQMRSVYDDPNFYFTVQDLWTQVQPLYKQLFTFVRRGLIRFYGQSIVRNDGPIPAHLLGSLWADNWQSIFKIIKSGNHEVMNIDAELLRQGYTPRRIFRESDEFFTSLGMPAMLPEFWRNSIIQNNNELYANCSTSAWDFCNNIDFRIEQCPQVRFKDYINAHIEMARIQFFMHNSHQPYVYRTNGNPALHEAVSQAIGLSVASPIHLHKKGLLTKPIEAESGNSMINIDFLLSLALEKLPLMSFSLSLEKWRWHMFEKGPTGMNQRWWELQLRFMGIIPPVKRVNEHFDPGANYHIISDEEYIKYFISTLLQFQIFSEMCDLAKHTGPLHTCDIYKSRDAGRILIDVMQTGSSVPLDKLIKLLTKGRTSSISTTSLLTYFRPLEVWLENQNREESVIGWNSNLDDISLFQILQQNQASMPFNNNLLRYYWTLLFVLVFYF